MSRSVIERRRKRIRGHRALRPLVLCGAMLAPALLAGGLLVAELTGYDGGLRGVVAGLGSREGKGTGAPVAMAPARDAVFEPRLLPPPPSSSGSDRSAGSGRPSGSERAYGGWAPPAVADVRRSTADVAPVEVPEVVVKVVPRRSEPPPVRRASPQPAPRTETGFGCPGEWRETWLWEVCKEQARREA